MAYVAAADLGLRPGARPWIVDYPPGATFGPRTLDDYELVWLLHGSAIWSCAGHEERLVPGSLLLARPGMTDEIRWDPDRPTRHAYIHFTLDRPTAPPDSWPVHRRLAHDDVLADLFRYLLWLHTAAPPHWQDRVDDTLRLLVAAYVSGPLPDPATTAPLPPAVVAAVEHLRRVWATGPTRAVRAGELAAAAAVSTSQLSRLFHARFGVGPAAAVELLRLGRAEGMLLRSNLTIGAIAADCGFADAYHFSRRFRTVYGVPPRLFRVGGPQAAAPADARTRLLPLRRLLWDLHDDRHDELEQTGPVRR